MRSLALSILVVSLCACAHPGGEIKKHDVGMPGLANRWWQWAFSAPDNANPVADRTGKHCAVGQSGDTWFLAGGYGSSRITRKCSLPEGKKLFFPVVNMVFYPKRPNSGYTCAEAAADAAMNNETAYELFVEVDGARIPDAKIVRAHSAQCFDIYAALPEGAKPYAAYPSATDGYWVKLGPLTRGRHVLKFGGRYSNSGAAFGKMVQDIEYELQIGDTSTR